MMRPADSLRERVWFSLKPGSWPKLLLPCALGQALGVATLGRVSWMGMVLGVMHAVCLAATIAWLNDWSDRDVDGIKRRMFPERGGQKTIHDRALTAHTVLLFGLGAGATCLSVGVLAAMLWGSLVPLAGAALCVGVFVAYSFQPLRMNYRGGGELFEMIGVGLLLPLYNGFLQAGTLDLAGLDVLPGHAVLALSSALASTIADEPSDRVGGKATFATMFGGHAVARVLPGVVATGVALWMAVPVIVVGVSRIWVVLPALIVAVPEVLDLWRQRVRDWTTNMMALAEAKQTLHHLIWRATFILAFTVFLRGWWGGV